MTEGLGDACFTAVFVFAGVFFAGDFFAGVFFAVGRVTGVSVPAVFLVAVFLVAAFLVAVFFVGEAFLAGADFLAAAGFFVAADFFAVGFFAGVFFAGVVFAGGLFAVGLFAGGFVMLGVDTDPGAFALERLADTSDTLVLAPATARRSPPIALLAMASPLFVRQKLPHCSHRDTVYSTSHAEQGRPDLWSRAPTPCDDPRLWAIFHIWNLPRGTSLGARP
ncbi:MAG: hypothetical protein V9E98_09270 [Candidatus Nanopelagicales bacterium]